jgi:hypothetical protein
MSRSIPAALTAALLSVPCMASDFSDRYPAGSLKTREDSQAALAAARAETARTEQEFETREAECYRGVLVNDCREKARKDRDRAQRDIRRVEVEARDLDRRLNAEEHEQRRAKAAAQPRDKPTESKAAESKAAKPREKLISAEQAARNRADYDARQQEHAAREAERSADASRRAANKAEYERKQAEAAKHAQEQEIERKRREERRAQRQQSLARQEAAREAVRAKAEAAAAEAAKNSN